MTQLPADFPPMPAENASLAAVVTWLIELIRWWVARAAARDQGEGAGEADPGIAPTPPEGSGRLSPDQRETDSPDPTEGATPRRGAGARKAVASLAPLGDLEPAEAADGAGRRAGYQTAPPPARRNRSNGPDQPELHRPPLRDRRDRHGGCDPPPRAGPIRNSETGTVDLPHAHNVTIT
jgi:hypothetical protein